MSRRKIVAWAVVAIKSGAQLAHANLREVAMRDFERRFYRIQKTSPVRLVKLVDVARLEKKRRSVK